MFYEVIQLKYIMQTKIIISLSTLLNFWQFFRVRYKLKGVIISNQKHKQKTINKSFVLYLTITYYIKFLNFIAKNCRFAKIQFSLDKPRVKLIGKVTIQTDD